MLGYLYTVLLVGLAIYALHILILTALYLYHKNDAPPSLPDIPEDELPTVTVQIPLCNERYVVQRILKAVAALDWPRDRLEIQILDDSTDDTLQLVQHIIKDLCREDLNIRLLHRDSPTGHKAGALAAGLQKAHGSFIAIFDADFCPPEDFLRSTVPHMLTNPELGMVQARWGHLNAEYSLITRAQSLALDAHFTVEHMARNRSGLLMNFNGTAGVWRRQAIESSGGWQSDTVAEDLDLSYRAQLAGWKILYLPDVVAPAELPPLVGAFKQQQYRWAKGAAQSLRKLALPIYRSPRLKFHQKVMALLHLSGYFTQPMFLLMLLLALPMALYTPHLPRLAAFLGGVTAIPPFLYLLGQIRLYRDWPKRMLVYPVLMLLGIGITWSTTLALADGLQNWGGQFVRTPKFRLQGRRGTWHNATYRLKIDSTFIGECAVLLYALLGVYLGLNSHQESVLLPLTVIYLGAEMLMVYTTLVQTRVLNFPTFRGE
ncbi:MAG: glycosyltransferase [Anaerolineae bacterium]|nr:glycosyltransferase [Anaerolineae bacterium]